MVKIRVGIVGCGAIGTEICRAIDEEREGLNLDLKFLIDRHSGKLEKLYSNLRKKPPLKGHNKESLNEFLEEIDLLIECASQSAVRDYVLPVLRKGKDAMLLSVGALVDEKLLEEIERVVEEKKCRIYIPSGAIAGIDGLRAAAIAPLHSVRLITRKNPVALSNNEYVKKRSIDLFSLKKEKILFEGNAKEAVRYFPENINVAAAISIAGIGSKRTEVKIVADPYVMENMHEIEAEGEFGKFFMRVENIQSQSNPKTSYLATLSAIATLKSISSSIKIGT